MRVSLLSLFHKVQVVKVSSIPLYRTLLKILL
nr:MAG TPA_asm: hypothetical protein [Caudoviricetes sp.]